MQLAHGYTEDIEHRHRFMSGVIIFFFVLVFVRLFFLQIVYGERYRFFSTENSIKQVHLPAPRGVIVDRRGEILVDNRPAFDVVVIPQYVVDPPKVLASLGNILSLDPVFLDEVWEKRLTQPKYQPLVVARDVPLDRVTFIRSRQGPWYHEESPLDFRGVEVHLRYQRTYPDGTLASHLLGYVREIDAERLEKLQKEFPGRYRRGDRLGIRGVEERLDLSLRGHAGLEEHVVDAAGREVDYEGVIGELRRKDVDPGDKLMLTIDARLQKEARDALLGKRGAVVMLEVNTGNILALASAPAFDLNRLAGPEGNDYWNLLVQDETDPLVNRPLQGTYPPASTYKIVTGVAALAEGVAKPEEEIFCGGGLRVGNRIFHCWQHTGHGLVNFHRAVVGSCDVYFYEMGRRLGVDRLAAYASRLGLGKKTGIELDDEKSGLIPTSQWKREQFGEPWQLGETPSVAVGQGYDLVTPLQNALMVARLVNGGKEIVPKVVQESGQDPESRIQDLEIGIDQEVMEKMRKALVGVVHEPGGTAGRLKSLPIAVGGKTGTAQVIQLSPGFVCTDEWCRDHAWFVGFAPADKPEVAIAILVEHGGFGASSAAPIAGSLFKRYSEIVQESPPSRSSRASAGPTFRSST